MEPAGFGLGNNQGLGVEETLVSRTDPEGTAEVRTRPATEAQGGECLDEENPWLAG